MTDHSDKPTLQEVGERFIVREITSSLTPSVKLLDGFGHDAAFVDFQLENDEILVINTDRSGLNIAYQLGLAGPECIGDLGVSHAISDVVAAGGNPKTVTIALLLPPNTEVEFIRKLMQGAEQAANRYGAIITGGDTKKNPKFAMVVTAIGTAHRDKRLRRSTAKKGDSLVVTGYLGSMLLGTIAMKRKMQTSDKIRHLLETALIKQNPPFELGRAIADAGIANACMDISDGLAGTLFSICTASNVGAIIDESKIPIHPGLVSFAQSLKLRPMQLSLAGGDWQYLYAVPPSHISTAKEISEKIGVPISIIGEIIETRQVIARTLEGDFRNIERIEHDSFAEKFNGKGYFENLSSPQNCFGKTIDKQDIKYLSDSY